MLSQKLKKLRSEKGVNQAQMAVDLGVSQGAVGKWETDRRIPEPETLRKIAVYFSVTVDYLLSDSDEQAERELVLLARKVPGLSEKEKSKLLQELNDTIDIYLTNKNNRKGQKR